MAEYIDREAFGNRISNTDWYTINKNGKLILGASDGDTALFKARDIFKAIHEQPAADVVEVVRCKDCRHYKKVYFCGETLYDCVSHLGMVGASPDDFCSYGERKGDCNNCNNHSDERKMRENERRNLF